MNACRSECLVIDRRLGRMKCESYKSPAPITLLLSPSFLHPTASADHTTLQNIISRAANSFCIHKSQRLTTKHNPPQVINRTTSQYTAFFASAKVHLTPKMFDQWGHGSNTGTCPCWECRTEWDKIEMARLLPNEPCPPCMKPVSFHSPVPDQCFLRLLAWNKRAR